MFTRITTVASLRFAALLALASAPFAKPLSLPTTDAESGSYCCQALQKALGPKVSFPASVSYVASLGTYWSQQEATITPFCVFSPTTTQDVSQGVAILDGLSKAFSSHGFNFSFAIRSGGHTPWAGSANIKNGVTIDMSALNQVTVAPDQSYTSIGPGNRWVDVYLKLDARGLAVPGGRVASVGVGGLVTGGGMSFFSARYGFVCDAVVNFEVVLANGTICNANANSHPDLWYALKGGSNNFGVVTRIDLKTFAQGKFWGGSIIYSVSTLQQQLRAFVDFTGQPTYDSYAALINSYAFTIATGWIIDNNIEYTKPVAYPPVFSNFTSIQPQFVNTMRISNLSDFTIELEATSTYGRRQIFRTATYVNDYDVLFNLYQQVNASLQNIITVPGLTYSLSLQPLPPAITRFGALTGGNALGLDPKVDGTLTLTLISATWDLATDDAAVTAAVEQAFANADAYASSKGKLNEFIYLNYAYKDQPVIRGYGAANLARLKAVSERYDPGKVFQKYVPGGFKLPS